jgi:hypothetical protein
MRDGRALCLFAAMMAIVVGCGPSISTPPSAGPPQPTIALQAALVDAFGRPWYCDPDFYPVGRDEMASMRERWSEVTADRVVFEAVAKRMGVDADLQPSDDERLAIYREWKALRAIALEPQADGGLRFDFLVAPPPAGGEGRQVIGVITADGRIVLQQESSAGEPNCPICLVAGTRIATPAGDIAVEVVRIGAIVWTRGADGRKVAAPVVEVGRVDIGPGHEATRVDLSDGRSITASAGHPLADGRPIGSLAIGDTVDGAIIVAVSRIANTASWTFDLRPSGPTGVYWAGGIPLGSTIAGP